MRFSLKKLFRQFHALPENFTSKDYRFFVFTNYAFFLAGIFHFVFIFVFAFLGIKILSILNILSSFIYAVCIYLNLRGKRIIQLIIANIEVLLHAGLCVLIIGWDSGFHYYILAVPLIIFLGNWHMASKIALCTFNAGIYVLLNYYSNLSATLASINPNYINWFERLNNLSIIFIISYFGYYFRFIVLSVENKLELEYQKTSEALDLLNEDLSNAADYIKTILPKPLTEGPVRSKWKFIPSTSLGGDAFGYHWLDKDNFAIYLLDVSGHGVNAALLSATITNVLRSHSLPGVDFCEPDQVLKSLNNSFPEEENNNMFFTIWYGVYNRNDHYLLYSSGGHPPALLLQSSSIERKHMVQLKTRNCAVGVFENSVYKKDFQALKANSYLYVFSDGAYEFSHPDGSRWKYEEFANYLSNTHSGDNNDIDRLVKSARDLNQSDVFEDDFTILRVSFHNV